MSLFARIVMKIFNFYFGRLAFAPPWIWPKSHDAKEKLNISATVRTTGLIFLPMIEACSSFISMKTCLETTFVKYQYWPQQEKFIFHSLEKGTWAKKKVEYLHYGSSKRTDFFTNDRGIYKLYIDKDMPRENPFVKCIVFHSIDEKVKLFYRGH